MKSGAWQAASPKGTGAMRPLAISLASARANDVGDFVWRHMNVRPSRLPGPKRGSAMVAGADRGKCGKSSVPRRGRASRSRTLASGGPAFTALCPFFCRSRGWRRWDLLLCRWLRECSIEGWGKWPTSR